MKTLNYLPIILFLTTISMTSCSKENDQINDGLINKDQINDEPIDTSTLEQKHLDWKNLTYVRTERDGVVLDVVYVHPYSIKIVGNDIIIKDQEHDKIFEETCNDIELISNEVYFYQPDLTNVSYPRYIWNYEKNSGYILLSTTGASNYKHWMKIN
jgi:hypothetical protein